MSKDMKKAIKLAQKRLPFRTSKAIEQNLQMFCGSYAEAYVAGAEEAQQEIVDRLVAAMSEDVSHER